MIEGTELTEAQKEQAAKEKYLAQEENVLPPIDNTAKENMLKSPAEEKKENIDQLWDLLKSKKVYSKSLDEFKTQFSTEENQVALLDLLKRKNIWD